MFVLNYQRVPQVTLYPLVICNITIENHNVFIGMAIEIMVMFQSYVRLPQGNWFNTKINGFFQGLEWDANGS